MSVVELTLSATRQPPADALRDLAAQCDALGVTSYDCYGDGPLRPEQSWLRQFEADVAACTGKESAVFMGSGVMAQDIALSIYGHIDCRTDRRQTFVCHYTSHILLHEQDSYSCLLHLDAAVIAKDESVSHQQPITYAALEPFLNAQPAPVCVLLECPHREIGGKLTPWEDLVAISAHCRRAGIPLHMDGARLWEAQGGYEKPFAEICALFDSVYASFYKGLGGLTGAMLIGSDPFIAQARVWQRRFGGVVYTQMPLAVSCWAGFRANRDAFVARKERMQQVVQLITATASEEASTGSHANALVRFDPPVPQVSLVHMYLRCSTQLAVVAKEAAAKECGVSCFMRIRGAGNNLDGIEECYTEFNMGPHNGAVPDDMWKQGWVCFLKHLRSITSEE